MNWKELIEHLQREYRLSGNELAALCGINQPSIARLRTGDTKAPHPLTIKKLEAGLAIKIFDSNPDDITYIKMPVYAVLPSNAQQVEVSHKSTKSIDTSSFSFSNGFNSFPVVSVVRAGTPNGIREDDIMEYATFNYPLDSGAIAVRVDGDSMAGELNNGDIVLLDKSAQINNGNIVVAVLDNNMHTIKKYRELTEELIELYPANHAYNTMVINKTKIQAIYKVVRSLRKH